MTANKGETMKCHTCGHQHRTMASVSSHDIGTRWYCHENDHSCYTLRNWDKAGLASLDRIIAGAPDAR